MFNKKVDSRSSYDSLQKYADKLLLLVQITLRLKLCLMKINYADANHIYKYYIFTV